MLDMDVRQKLGAFQLDARFVTDGRVTALFGPSGSGKTSIISLMAGLSRPDAGTVCVAGRVLADTDRRIFVPPHRRRVGCVFQDARLFPHMSARSNLGYGARFAGSSDPGALGRVVDLLGIGHLLERRPRDLSGGERQRVAIGRALLASPEILLLDEPLAALDEARKAEIMPYLERLRDESRIPIVLVSHSVSEVARLADTVVLMDRGKVVSTGPVSEVLGDLGHLPETFRDEGGSVVEARMTAYDETHDITTLSTLAGHFHVAGRVGEEGAHVRVRIRARDVMIATGRPQGISALNLLEGRIAALQTSGRAHVDVHVDCAGIDIVARITALSAERLGLAQDLGVFAVIKTVSLEGVPGRTEREA